MLSCSKLGINLTDFQTMCVLSTCYTKIDAKSAWTSCHHLHSWVASGSVKLVSRSQSQRTMSCEGDNACCTKPCCSCPTLDHYSWCPLYTGMPNPPCPPCCCPPAPCPIYGLPQGTKVCPSRRYRTPGCCSVKVNQKLPRCCRCWNRMSLRV